MGERVVFVVNGYGCHVVPVLISYARRIVHFANEMSPITIVLCGGPTQQKTAPNMTEAETMRDIILFRLSMMSLGALIFDPEIILGDRSFTTLDNIRNAAHLLRNTPFNRIVIFCEAQRALKTLILARHYFRKLGPDKISVETESWELRDPMKELRSTIAEVAALYIPGLRQLFHWMRVRRAKRI